MTKPDVPWIDTRLTEEEMNFLGHTISEENLRGAERQTKDFSKDGLRTYNDLVDKDNWFFKSALKKLTERMFYRDWNNYYKYHIEKEEPLPEFEIDRWWVNYQNQYEFSDFHNHSGLFSFVIFMKIPTHYSVPTASNFQFVWSEKNTKNVISTCFQLSPEDEGRMLFFPDTLQHKGVVTHNTEEERITISGNIHQYDSSIDSKIYEGRKHMLRMVEKHAEELREDLTKYEKTT